MTVYMYYISFHTLHLLCVWHTCFTAYNYYEPVSGIDVMGSYRLLQL